MSEPTLATAYEDLRSDLGYHGGYGRGEAAGERAWNPKQTANIAMCLKTGLRSFYHCGFDWSFLKPTTTLTLAAAESTLVLPGDYGSMDGPINLGTGGSVYRSLTVGGASPVYLMTARNPTTTGFPQFVCEEPIKGTTHQRGQRMRLKFWPIADQAYTLTFPYRINPDALDGTLPYAYGGAQHAQTLLQACKAAFERDVDGVMDGPQQMAFKQMLQASIVMDRRSKPQSVGINGDRSDLLRRGRVYDRQLLPVIVQGSIPD